MKWKVLFASLAIAGMMFAPSAAAVHGSPYHAVGVAYKHIGVSTPTVGWLGPVSVPDPDDMEIYDAEVQWTGWWYRTYVVTITDRATGEVVVQDEFPGMEQWGCCAGGGWEFFQYHGCTRAGASTWGGTCTDDPVDFDVYGIQAINIQAQQQYMLYSGWYNEWALYLIVEDHVDDLL